jgi:hypothetical protein
MGSNRFYKLPNASKPATITPQPQKVKFRRPLVLTDGDIFSRLWIRPRLVFAYLNQYQYDRYTVVLLFLGAASAGLELAIASHLNKGMSLSFIIATSIVAGGIFGTIVCYIFAAVASGIGLWFGGQAPVSSIVRVIAYGLFPVAIASVFTVIKIILFDIDLFREDFNFNNYAPELSAFYVICSLLQLVLASCSILFIVIGTSQVQKMPIGVAMLNLILPALILAVVAGLIAIPFL